MNNYNFSMEKILEWRSDIEKEKMESFGRLQRSLKEEQDKLKELLLEIQEAKLNSMSQMDIYKLQQYNRYKESIEEKIIYQEKAILELKNSLEDNRLELITAQKDRSIMEKLKERDFSNYKKNIDYQEQKELDEIAVLRYKPLGVY